MPDATSPAANPAAAALADALVLIEQLRDQLAALAEQNDSENPGQEIVEVREIVETADEFLLAHRQPASDAAR